MLIDTHAHVNFNSFKDDADEVLKSCLDEDIWVVNVGSEYKTSKRAVELAGRYERGVYAIVGLHPIHTHSQHVDEEETSFTSREEHFDDKLYKTLITDPKVVGIGECGLDYYRLPEEGQEEIKQKQKKAFLQQVELASDTGKVLMVHSRDAYEDIASIISEHKSTLKHVVIHSFIGSPEEAIRFVDMGCFISFNGIITYKPRKERKPGQSDPGLLEAVELVPLDKILIETDCPYLAPEPVRGSRNTPLNVKYVATELAKIKNVSEQEVVETTTATARSVFNI